MTVPLEPALAALAGSTIGGLTTLAVTLMTQRVQARAALTTRDLTVRQKLYRKFIEGGLEALRRRADAQCGRYPDAHRHLRARQPDARHFDLWNRRQSRGRPADHRRHLLFAQQDHRRVT